MLMTHDQWWYDEICNNKQHRHSLHVGYDETRWQKSWDCYPKHDWEYNEPCVEKLERKSVDNLRPNCLSMCMLNSMKCYFDTSIHNEMRQIDQKKYHQQSINWTVYWIAHRELLLQSVAAGAVQEKNLCGPRRHWYHAKDNCQHLKINQAFLVW